MHQYRHQLSQLELTIAPLVAAINQHPIFSAIDSIDRLRRFAQIHVYAVWDFMCLLKALQRKLSFTNLLWLPPLDHLGCHLVNTMLAEEESDFIAEKRYLSHFELYLEAMQQCGADIAPISAFINEIKQQLPLDKLLTHPLIPAAARQFMAATFSVIAKQAHHIAASFAFARENITSAMFGAISHSIAHASTPKQSLDSFRYYFQRHIDLDGGKHSLQSKTLVVNLCGTDEKKWQEATETALFSLESRLQLLEEIYAHLIA